jgi:hypothetical protein
LCAPFITGIKICQPANGCHVEGDICTKDTDCCGGPLSGVPGGGLVLCSNNNVAGTVGICERPTTGTGDAGSNTCDPEGDICHFQAYACNISSSRNNCCPDPSNKTICQLDPLGVPRCHYLGLDGGGACVAAGQACAFSSDCCGGLPCVPNGSGGLICCSNCVTSDAGGSACVPPTGNCTVNADCCNGSYCQVQPGSTQGTCNPVPVPPPPPDAGPLPDGAPPVDSGGGGGGSCSLYGQGCATASDCCNNVPCTQSDGLTACTGQAGCTCVFPLH